MTTSWLVTGAGGQLGRVVVDTLRQRGDAVIGCTHDDLAVEDDDAVRRVFGEYAPDAVVHCAAWTAVDACEDDPDRADRINGHGTGYVAEACRAIGAALVYISTDFVFDGAAAVPYAVDAVPAPLSAYGRSKLLGEEAVLRVPLPERCYAVRTSWVFGPGGKNFPATMLRLARAGAEITVVTDQRGTPTMTRDLALALVDLALSGADSGVYHATNAGECTWHQFAVELFAEAGLSATVAEATTAEFAAANPWYRACRPAYSVLDCRRLTEVRGCALPHYRDAMRRYLEEENS